MSVVVMANLNRILMPLERAASHSRQVSKRPMVSRQPFPTRRAEAMSKIKVLVVDDAVVVRSLVVKVLGSDPDIEVVGTAANGQLALDMLEKCHPDLITLDIEMPVMDGIQALTHIRKSHPRLPVIMFSTLTERGASSTFEALSRGASDYVTKPSNTGKMAESMEKVRQDLIPKIKALCSGVLRGAGPQTPTRPAIGRPAAAGRPGAAAPSHPQAPLRSSALPGAAARTTPGPDGGRRAQTDAARPAAPGAAARPGRRVSPVEIVAIGVSTGGPNALADVIPELPADFPVPILIVQHMPPVFTRLLAERLNTRSKLKVVEAAPGMTIAPGTVYIAPGDYHMTVRRDGATIKLAMNQDAQENSCRPAVDPMFRSVSATFGAGVLAVVLTGMGSDGFHGAEAVRAKGGRIVVQDEATSVVWGMPGFVAKANLADEVLPLNAVPGALERLTMTSRRSSAPGGASAAPASSPALSTPGARR
jgi:two-component system, chemotaxis family, protein-glutamate methylesterase/glutaminase